MANTSQPLLVFGSQIAYNEKALSDIQITLQNKSSRQWMLDTVAGLPKYWDSLAEALPKITDTAGPEARQLLEALGPWLQSNGTTSLSVDGDALPSSVFVPLIVLSQLADYRRFLEANKSGKSDPQADLVANKTPALGFCMGLLGAYAVASSHNLQELDQYGAVAVRLAMLAGALSDSQESSNPHRTYAMAWTNTKQHQELWSIVDGLSPDAYVSLLFDEARATVTVSERAASKLVRKARAAGIVLSDTGFRGELHSPKATAKAQIKELVAFCDGKKDLQFGEVDRLALTTFTNAGDGKPLEAGEGSLHSHALETLFARQCDWYGTFGAVKTAYLAESEAPVITFGPDRCLPPTLVRGFGTRAVHFADIPVEPSTTEYDPLNDDPNAIAIIGMSIKTSGAEDVEEFSELLKKGSSQHEKVTRERLNFDSLFRDPDLRQYYCNWVGDVDAFDHKFFKRSPRESAAMDPQHRLLLQASYQAVEQAGMFTEAARAGQDGDRDRNHVGVFIGSPSVDYEHNVSTHPLTAFHATGNLQSYLPGRVANYFGWTGPAIAYDTACSSSAVAIHSACTSLRNEECSAALAGGVCILTNPHWFQNLTAASFLSPTGQCKPFDEKGDGYCRAEAIAVVMLKRMADARRDGNPILGRLASSAVYQNTNATPIFVPNSPSLAQLFGDVVKKAKVPPSEIALVEAHGTGTAVGDPAEWAALRKAVGGPIRQQPLPIGSVKGHVGHTEGASGAVSLVKVLMMMNKGFIPPQASHSKMNATIKAADTNDMMEVVTKLRNWDGKNKVVLINNYGASGSNAAMVVASPPPSSLPKDVAPIKTLEGRFPFFLSGSDARAIKDYAAKLAATIKRESNPNLAELSFNVTRHSNPELPQRFALSARVVGELVDRLENISDRDLSATPAERPVVLCFGGQVSTFVGLDRKLYDSIAILRHHLDECDKIIQGELGLSSIFPDIFAREALPDSVRLQLALFAMQYASAQSWIDCGLSGKVVGVVGHSFGELTALCISGALSLKDSLTLVARRAQLVRDAWGEEKGSMMAVEGDEPLVQELLKEAGSQASIACFNGPRSFTLAGSGKAIDAVAEAINANKDKYSGIRSKRLNVTNAFHSSLVDPLVERLEQVGSDLKFHEPLIHLERATETAFTGPLTAKFVPDHMRKPVYFSHAMQRLAEKYPAAIFLEAGSSSTITVMASRALAGQASKSHHFESVSVTNDKGIDGLTDVTVSLWKQGLRVAFWGHHALQTGDYKHILLPPYQFEKSRHWMDYKSASDLVASMTHEAPVAAAPETDPKHMPLWEFLGYQGDRGHPRFRVNIVSETFKKLVAGHVFAHTAPVLSGTVQSDIAVEALFSIHPEWKEKGFIPTMLEANIPTPICVDSSRKVVVDLTALDEDHMMWQLEFSSTAANGGAPRRHLHGRIHMRDPNDPAFISQFERFERLIPYERCAELLAKAGGPGVEILQGSQVYKAFSDFIEYSEDYAAMYSVVGKKDECAGRVHRRHGGKSFLDLALHDSFKQVSGLYLNAMSDAHPGEIHIGSDVELVMRSPKGILKPGCEEDEWHVYARHSQISARVYLADAFVFSAKTGELVEVILGLQYTRMGLESMKRLLVNLTKDQWALDMSANGEVVPPSDTTTKVAQPAPAKKAVEKKPVEKKKEVKEDTSSSPKSNLTMDVKKVLSSVVGVDVNSITLDSEAADIGIDSLMGIELLREVNQAFDCGLDLPELLAAATVREIINLIASALDAGAVEVTDDDDDDTESSDAETQPTSTTVSEPDTSPSGVESPIKGVKLEQKTRELTAREVEAERYVAQYTAGWTPAYSSEVTSSDDDAVVIVTGATGSLGVHVVAALAEHPAVKTVVCVNRHRPTPVETRQDEALTSRGIKLSPGARSKLRILSTDTSQPKLGLQSSEWQWLAKNASHIVHSAWPLSGSRPMAAFSGQFQAMRNLLDLAAEMAAHRRVGFQLVSSLSVVGHSDERLVPEDRVPMDWVLPPGYGEGKWVCERMLDETVHKHPRLFRSMAVRPAQIAGSSTSGVWNSVEQVPFIVKSAQSLRVWPDLPGTVRWIPVDDVAAILVDLLYLGEDSTAPTPYPVYHIDDPNGRPWSEISAIMADALDIPADKMVSFDEWLRLVGSSPKPETENPAGRLAGFLKANFPKLSCGELVLDTVKAQEHSAAMRALPPVSEEIARRYVQAWKDMGFLAQ